MLKLMFLGFRGRWVGVVWTRGGETKLETTTTASLFCIAVFFLHCSFVCIAVFFALQFFLHCTVLSDLSDFSFDSG